MYNILLVLYILCLTSLNLYMVYFIFSESKREMQENLEFERKQKELKLNLSNVKKIRYEKVNGKIVKKEYRH